MVQTLLELGTNPSQIHLIGLSLGAHLASYVAKDVPGIGRLTGKYSLSLYNSTIGPTFCSQTVNNQKLETLSPKRDAKRAYAPDGHLQRVAITDAVLIQFGLLMMSTTLLETCRGL